MKRYEISKEHEFEFIHGVINKHWERAIGLANFESLVTYWSVGAFVSAKLKTAVWGTKTVEELSDYLKTRDPKLRGYGKRNIYNMVMFYETYVSDEFQQVYKRLKLNEFIQIPSVTVTNGEIVQLSTAQFEEQSIIVQPSTAQLGETDLVIAAFPVVLTLIGFTNHVEILNRCKSIDERVFYILYAARERLNSLEMRRAIIAQTYDTMMSREKMISAKLKTAYPGAEFLLKDKAFLDFLHLPPKHTEHVLRKGLIEHMKEFILEIGKDFLYMGNEYHVHVGGEIRRLDLLFYHRGLRCLVDVELKAVDFQPEFVGKLDMYLEAIDREIRREGENPSVGIILCPSADKCRVEYTLNRTMSPVMVAEYRRLLVPEEVMKKSLEEYCAFIKMEAIQKSK